MYKRALYYGNKGYRYAYAEEYVCGIKRPLYLRMGLRELSFLPLRRDISKHAHISPRKKYPNEYKPIPNKKTEFMLSQNGYLYT